MTGGILNYLADEGKHFVLTKYGYENSPSHVKHERKVNEPVKGFEFKVPYSWVSRGLVKEVIING